MVDVTCSYVILRRTTAPFTLTLGIWTRSSTWFLGPTRPTTTSNGISIESAVFPQNTLVANTNGQTDRTNVQIDPYTNTPLTLYVRRGLIKSFHIAP